MKTVLVIFVLFSTSLLKASEVALQKPVSQRAYRLNDPANRTITPQQQLNDEAGSTTYFNVMRTGVNQAVYSLGENHGFRLGLEKQNKKLLDALVAMLKEANERDNENVYHVLVEHGRCLQSIRYEEVKETNDATFLFGLVSATKELSKAVRVEAADVRNSIFLLKSLLFICRQNYDSDNPPAWFTEQCRVFKEETGYDINEVRFIDLITEFDKLFAYIADCKDQWHDKPLIQQEFTRILDKALKQFSLVRLFIMSGGLLNRKDFLSSDSYPEVIELRDKQNQLLLSEDKIFDFVQCNKRNDAYMHFLNSMKNFTSFAASRLLDGHFFHRVLQLKFAKNPPQKIVLFAGGAHCKKVRKLLIRTENGSESYAPFRNRFYASHLALLMLPLEELEKLNPSKSTFCVLQ